MIQSGCDSGLGLRAHSSGRIVGAMIGGLILYHPHHETHVFVVEGFAFFTAAALHSTPAQSTASIEAVVVDTDESRVTALRSALCCFVGYCVPHYGTVAFFFLTGPLRFSAFSMTVIEGAVALATYLGTTAGPGWPELNIVLWMVASMCSTSTLIMLAQHRDVMLDIPAISLVLIPLFVTNLMHSRVARSHAHVSALVSSGHGVTYTIVSAGPKMGKMIGKLTGFALLHALRVDHDDFTNLIPLLNCSMGVAAFATTIACVALVHSAL